MLFMASGTPVLSFLQYWFHAEIAAKTAKQIITVEMCRENSFQTIKLSTDVTGWPSSLDITVYLHRDDVGRKKPEMHIRFLPPDDGAEYNIKDDSAKYQLLIK